MNTETLLDNLHQGFRITVGATTVLLETLQDPDKRSQTLANLQSELSQKTQEWASKGEITEQEGRRLVEDWLQRLRDPQGSPPAATIVEVKATAPDSPLKAEILELTEQISHLRAELEKLRDAN